MAIKTETVTIKVTPEEKRKIKEAAEDANLTVSKYLYSLLLKKEEN